MDLKHQLLEDHPDSLRLVGYGPFMRWIVRDSEPEDETPGPRYSPIWPLEKVAHRTAEDYGNAEWEWLLRHHDHGSLGALCFFSSRTGLGDAAPGTNRPLPRPAPE